MTTQIKEYTAIDKGIGAMTRKYKVVPACDRKEGFEDCKKQHREIRKVYTALEKKRKELKSPLSAKIKLLDDEAKAIVERLDVISIPYKDAITERTKELAEIEAERVKNLKKEISDIQAFIIEGSGKNSDEISSIIESVDMIEVDEHFEEFQTEARESLIITKAKLGEMLAQAIQKEVSDKALEEQQAANQKLQDEIDALKAANAGQTAKATVEEKESDPDCSVQKTETVELPLKDAIDDWASAWKVELPAIQELSAILKERGLI